MKLNEPVKIFPGAQVIGDVEIGENCSISVPFGMAQLFGEM